MQSHLGNGSAHNSQSSPEFRSFHQAENKLPWRCRVFRGRRCLCDRGRSRGGRSLGEAACTAAGSRRLPSNPPGGRSVCSDASHTATLCYIPDHRRCPEGGTGCCCVSVKQKGFLSSQGPKEGSVRPGSLTSCFPMHHFSVRKVQGGHFSSVWQLWNTGIKRGHEREISGAL